MQREVTRKNKLLKEDGSVNNPGWARTPLWQYNRDNIKAARLRLKEWDYYCILSETKGIALTLSDMGYLGFAGITVLDLGAKSEISNSRMALFPMGRWNLPNQSSTGISEYKDKHVLIRFKASEKERVLDFSWENFAKGKNLAGHIKLNQRYENHSITVATPFRESRKSFYYNQKINNLAAQGSFSFGKKKEVFTPGDSFGVLDWGRGVWTYTNTWYWGSASGMIGEKPAGFNIGYGFGDLSTHSENAFFYDGNLIKLDRITFDIPEDSYLSPWHFSDNEGRITMDFAPTLERKSKTDLLLIKSDQHQIFGSFTGKITLDNGDKLDFKDLPGFAEKVYNRW